MTATGMPVYQAPCEEAQRQASVPQRPWCYWNVGRVINAAGVDELLAQVFAYVSERKHGIYTLASENVQANFLVQLFAAWQWANEQCRF